MTTTLRRASATCAVAAATVALAAPSQAATATGSDAAASFLAAQMAAGGHQFTSSYDGQSYPDTGLTADGILALTSARTAGSEAASATTAFAKNVGSYTGAGTEKYAGPTAKSILVATAQGRSPRAFGGVDLVAQLKGLEKSSGRFSDVSSYGDYSNALTQSLAIIALTKAGAPADAKATNYLLTLRCSDGGFRMMDDGTACVSDPDATSVAVQALAATGGHSSDIAKAVAYLGSKQTAAGGIGGGSGAAAPNSNSTGLAAVAFTLGGQSARAAKAQSFVTSLLYDCTFPSTVRGAIAYDRAAYTAMKSAGSSAKLAGNETRATSQGIFAFTKQPIVALTAGGQAAAPSISCSTPAPSSPSSSAPATSAPKPSSSASATTAPSTSAPQPSSSASGTPAPTTAPGAPASSSTDVQSGAVTGPLVNTDKVSGNTVPFGLAFGAVLLITAGGAVAYARRH